MTGRYTIEIYNNRVHYFLTIRRNITILQGNTATGKTELIRLVQAWENDGSSSGITIKSEKICTVLTNADWKLRLANMNDRIIFIDETASFYRSKEFAEMVRGSDNYFVIVTRDSLNQLPYSIDEIYGLRQTNPVSKYKTFKRVYNELYHIYNLSSVQQITPQKVIVEDSNAGYTFYQLLFTDRCISSHGKSNVNKVLMEMKDFDSRSRLGYIPRGLPRGARRGRMKSV